MGICETIVTEDHDEYFKGEQLHVMQNGAELPLADSPLDGEGYPSSAEQADEQKDLALSLVFFLQVVVDHQHGHRGSWPQAIMLAWITQILVVDLPASTFSCVSYSPLIFWFLSHRRFSTHFSRNVVSQNFRNFRFVPERLAQNPS